MAERPNRARAAGADAALRQNLRESGLAWIVAASILLGLGEIRNDPDWVCSEVNDVLQTLIAP
jgi:hypothetical protein